MGVHHVPLFLVVILGSFLQTTQDNLPITVKSCQHTDVLLPCNCLGMTHRLKWQKNDTLIYSNNRITKNNKYTDRITMFLNETSKNCSILLNNISEEDGGEYNCTFNEGSIYSRGSVMLIIINSAECPAVTASPVMEDNPSTHSPKVYIPLIIMFALLLVGCIFAVLRIRPRNQPSKTDEEAALDCKNPGTLSEDSSD